MLGDALSTLNAQFAYRLMNLCVKAEPVSLLSIEAMIEGEPQKLEACIPALAQAIFMDHPEFKQEMKTMQVDISTDENNPDMQDVHYINVTMPEVDDDRYDVLKNGAKTFYEENKAQMEAVSAEYDAKLAKLTEGESDEDIKKVKEAREKQTKTWYEQRDKIYNEKLKEIEEGHMKWLTKQGEERLKRLGSTNQ